MCICFFVNSIFVRESSLLLIFIHCYNSDNKASKVNKQAQSLLTEDVENFLTTVLTVHNMATMQRNGQLFLKSTPRTHTYSQPWVFVREQLFI